MGTASSSDALAFSLNGEGERLDSLGAFDLIFNEGYKNVGLLVDLGDGRQEGALFEILVEREKCFADVALRCQFNRSHHSLGKLKQHAFPRVSRLAEHNLFHSRHSCVSIRECARGSYAALLR